MRNSHVIVQTNSTDATGTPGHEVLADATTGTGKRIGFPALERAVKKFVLGLMNKFGLEIETDPRGFKKRAIQLFRRNLPPFAGRPSEQAVTAAAELRGEGRPWREIYPVVIPQHATIDPATRRQAESNLRSAIRSRRNSRKRRKRQAAAG